jgi:predicted CoA-binding protein
VRTPRQILEQSNTIAVVGASRHEEKAAYAVPLQLKLHGWRVIPVNPYADEIWGERCYPTLADISEPVDMVDVFRPSAQAADVVLDAVAIGATAVWLQQASRHRWAARSRRTPASTTWRTCAPRSSAPSSASPSADPPTTHGGPRSP